MKLIKLLLLSSLVLFTSCTDYHEIENNVLITACFANVKDNSCEYTFYISLPKRSDSEGENAQSSAYSVYCINAENFDAALSELKVGGKQHVDTSHLSLFGGNRSYFEGCFKKDEKYIRKHIKASGLVYTCTLADGPDKLIDCIESEFDSSPSVFSKNVLGFSSSGLKSTLAELSLCVNNAYYTAAIPEISIMQYGDSVLPMIKGVCMYNSLNNIVALSENETRSYMAWRRKNGRYYKSYKIYTKEEMAIVKLNDAHMVDIASKYALMNTDVLNIRYYCASNFKSYDDYKKYFDNYMMYETKFVCGEI